MAKFIQSLGNYRFTLHPQALSASLPPGPIEIDASSIAPEERYLDAMEGIRVKFDNHRHPIGILTRELGVEQSTSGSVFKRTHLIEKDSSRTIVELWPHTHTHDRFLGLTEEEAAEALFEPEDTPDPKEDVIGYELTKVFYAVPPSMDVMRFDALSLQQKSKLITKMELTSLPAGDPPLGHPFIAHIFVDKGEVRAAGVAYSSDFTHYDHAICRNSAGNWVRKENVPVNEQGIKAEEEDTWTLTDPNDVKTEIRSHFGLRPGAIIGDLGLGLTSSRENPRIF